MKLIYNSIFLGHDTGTHPENKERLKFFQGAEETEVPNGEEFLGLVHSKNHIENVKRSVLEGKALDIDTLVSEKSFEVACYAVGAAVKASEENSFAVVRPPGHHATRNRAMGFCIFNNIAVAAKKLINEGKKVFVFDFDVHHGNGTQDILENEKNSFYFSLHQDPMYPGTGLSNGVNYENVPLSYATEDDTYISFLNGKLVPALEKFNPDIVAVSAGFDSYYKDLDFMFSGVGFNLTEKTFSKIKEILKSYNSFFVLEGGYNPESIKEGVDFFIK